jgi:aspartate carbamoyltransferase catalytic subunit
MAEAVQHFIDARTLSRRFLEEELFPLAARMERVVAQGGARTLAGKRIYNLFFDTSVRTRLSFESAADFLGARSRTEADARRAFAPDETLEDAVRAINDLHFDAIVLRHDQEGGAARAARVSAVPVINAGDGTGQHPTQGLLDLYTIAERRPVDGVRVVFVGENSYGRNVDALVYLLGVFDGVALDFVSPLAFRPARDVRQFLEDRGVPYTTDLPLDAALPRADVVYMSRAHSERFTYGERADGGGRAYRLERAQLGLLSPTAAVMHPGPRNERAELPEEVDDDPRVIFRRQTENGLFVRMALLQLLLARPGAAGVPTRPAGGDPRPPGRPTVAPTTDR